MSQLLETPDFYWSEAKLEELYQMMSRTLDVNHRISILNKKLDYANELVSVLRGHLSEKHSNKLVLLPALRGKDLRTGAAVGCEADVCAGEAALRAPGRARDRVDTQTGRNRNGPSSG